MAHPRRRKAEAAPPDLGPFQEFINAVGASVVVFSPDRKIVYMNDHAARAWSTCEVGEYCYRALRNSREVCKDCPFDEVLETHRWLRREMRMRTSTGWRTHENLYLYARGANPGTRVVAMVSMDVHETTSLKKEVLKERELSRALLESVNSVVLGFRATGDVEFVNHVAETTTGYTEREIIRGGGIELLVPSDALAAAREYFARPPDEPRQKEPALIPIVAKSGSRRMVSWTYSPLILGEEAAAGGIAIGQDVTERFSTRKEAEKKAAELEIVNSILSRVGAAADFEEMLSVALDHLLEMPAYTNGAAFILEGGATEASLVAARGYTGAGPDELMSGTERVFPATAVYNRRIEIAPRGTKVHAKVEEVMGAEGNSGMVAIPLFPGGHPVGLVILGYHGEPSAEEMGMEVLRASAEALELGAENAYLRVKAERRASEATALLKANQALTGAFDVTEALREVASQVADLLEVEGCGIFLFDEGSETIRLAAGYPPEAFAGINVSDTPLRVHKAASEVAHTLKPLAIHDVAADDRVPEYVSRKYGVKSSMHVPLVAEGKFIGAIYLAMTSRLREFTASEAELVESFARQSSIAIRNVSLLNDLRESEERYRTIMENSGVGFIIHDGENIIYANEGARRIVDDESRSYSKISEILELSPPEERQRMLDYVRRRLSGDEMVPRVYDATFRQKDGSLKVVELIHTPITIGGRRVIVIAANDITYRVKAEEAVKASEEKYRTLIESSRDAIMIADPKGIILFANAASARLSGKSPEEMTGDSVYVFVHPDEKDSTRRKFVREWEAGRNVARFPVRSMVLGEEKFFEATTAILGELGPDANVMLIASDVTERELAQRRLEESEDKYRTIVETTHDAIISVNRAGEVLFANKAVEPMLGLPFDEVIGKNVFSFVHPEDRDEASKELARDFKTGKASPNYAVRCVRPDGGVIFVEVNSGLVGWPGDDTIEILVIRDITDRRRHEEEREERLRVEAALSAITSRFVDPVDMDQAILFALEGLSDYLGGSAAFYVEIGTDGRTIQQLLEWSKGGEPFAKSLQVMDASDFTYLFPRLSLGEEVVLEDVSELPAEIGSRFRDGYNVDSFAALPIFVGSVFRGALGYASVGRPRGWSQLDLELLRAVAVTISLALERRAFVEELARSEKFRSRITESIGEGLVVLSNGLVTWANAQFSDLSGYDVTDLEGKTLEVLIPEPERASEVAELLVKSVLEEGGFSTEDRLRRADGSLIDVQFSVTSLGLTEQGAAELLVAIRDITESKRMRQEVESAAEAYSTLFSNAGDALIVHTRDGVVLSANERALTYTGYPPDELIGMNMKQLAPEWIRERYHELEIVIEREGALTFESRLLKRDGSILPIEATSRLTRIWGDEVVLSALRDISERKKAEEETARRAAQMASLNEIVKASTSTLDLETALEAILRVTVEVSRADAGMIVLAAGPDRSSTSIAFNKAEDKFHGPMGEDRMRALMNWVSTRWQGTLLMDAAAEGGKDQPLPFVGDLSGVGIAQALFIPLYSGEKSIGVIALGTRTAETFDERDIGFYDAAGAEIGVSIENALIYRELTAEHERLSLLYRSAQSISGELGLQSLLDTTAAEAAKAVGAPSALIALIEPGCDAFVFSASFNLDLGLLTDIELPIEKGIGGAVVSSKRAVIIPSGGPSSEEERRLFESDPILGRTHVDFAAALPLIAGDRVVGVFALGRPTGRPELSPEDVLLLEAIGRQAGVAIQNARLYEETREHLRALEIAHQELMVLDRMKSDFVSTVSHELRSPLAVIEGFANTLSEHFDRIDVETQKESIEIILKKSIALEGLIENILDMSRIEEGRLDVAREPFDIIELCREVSEDQERIEELHEILLEADRSPLIIIADREKTEVALGNLVRNALKFSPEGGRVAIEVKKVDGMAEISVSDQGIGIAPDQLERVFDRFYQIDSSETRSFPGSGLGLYITKELVQSMGGTVRIESEQGAGSIFTFTLPLER
ncbi:MAG: PAS domain S-box protein [Candidatus Geothermincolia bacterium]